MVNHFHLKGVDTNQSTGALVTREMKRRRPTEDEQCPYAHAQGCSAQKMDRTILASEPLSSLTQQEPEPSSPELDTVA